MVSYDPHLQYLNQMNSGDLYQHSPETRTKLYKMTPNDLDLQYHPMALPNEMTSSDPYLQDNFGMRILSRFRLESGFPKTDVIRAHNNSRCQERHHQVTIDWDYKTKRGYRYNTVTVFSIPHSFAIYLIGKCCQTQAPLKLFGMVSALTEYSYSGLPLSEVHDEILSILQFGVPELAEDIQPYLRNPVVQYMLKLGQKFKQGTSEYTLCGITACARGFTFLVRSQDLDLTLKSWEWMMVAEFDDRGIRKP
jgi:hypothetical protein